MSADPTAMLELALRRLNETALRKILASLDSDATILVGNWTKTIYGERCGCLMMDGYARAHTHGKGNKGFPQYLAEKYGLKVGNYEDAYADDGAVLAAAGAFDKWAYSGSTRWRRVKNGAGKPIKILSTEGKRDVAVIAQAALDHILINTASI